ncbi:MAG: putative transcriptional regulator [Burkholderiales bacterium]|jgi:ATP-dependent DNA helicase RecG|nr:putative transcriptional regulator [Burkholderiales bacterium]
MNVVHIKQLLSKGEGISIEFKECRTELNRNVYETVRAFLNRIGGEILV